MLKCSIAYLLGSLATFIPAIAGFLGPQDGKHMVATVTVYFHPARSQGSMFEAIILAAVAFLYAVIICFTSMGVSILFGRTLDLLVVGHLVVLIVFCGGGLGFVGWVKQHLAHPLVNIACSLTSLAIITVLTKEGAVQAAQFSDDKVTMVLKMIVMGVLATTGVCFLISPVSARTELRQSMINITDSFGELLSMVTTAFLTGSASEAENHKFRTASDKYKSQFKSLSKNLKEAKYEYYVMGREREYHIEAKLVDCMRRLGQDIGGLRSAASTQFLLLSQGMAAGVTTPVDRHSMSLTRAPSFSILTEPGTSPSESHGVLTAIDEISEDGAEDEAATTPKSTNQGSTVESDYVPTANSPGDIFTRFIVQLGPSMKSLAVTLKQLLDELPYASESDYQIAYNPQFSSSLSDAIALYSKAREEALQLLYKDKELSIRRPVEIQADFEEVAASCGYFSFSLQDLAHEIESYLHILENLKSETEHRPAGRTWSWLRFWRSWGASKADQRSDPGTAHFFCFPKHTDSVTERNISEGANERSGSLHSVSTFAERKAVHIGNLSPQAQPLSYRYRLWKILSVFRRDDTKFAVKVGAGAALYALPSFLVSTRPLYQHWRGEWGLLSYMLVCSMTIGASNTTGFARFAGTCIGAVCAIAGWIVSRGNAILLACFGWIMSYWTAYIIVVQGKGPMGRFIMLTYNLSALYAYSLSVKDLDDDDDEGGINPLITEITAHRVVAVLVGCLWGLVVTRFVWPISARRKFVDGLSLLWLRMGLIWKRDPLAVLLDGQTPNTYMDIREELELSGFLTRLESLRSAATSEMDLRGPFPDTCYGKILRSTNNMLDAFHAMNVVIMKDPKVSKGEAEILRYTRDERAQLCSRISHLFSVLASSMKLQYPLNEALPSTEHARDRLLAKIFRFRKELENSGATDEDFALLYAYALVTGQLSSEIDEVGRELEKLFGTLNEDALKLQ